MQDNKVLAKHLHRPHTAHQEHDHNHMESSHAHDYKSLDRKKLILSMVITAIVMVVEIIGGVISNSIALLSDAGHMFTHFFALLLSYIAIRLATVEPCHHRTFGLFRAEVLASLFNGIFLIVVTGFIVLESVKRFISPKEIAAKEMLFVALIGLLVNIATIFILHGSQKGDRNIKSAFLHMIADALSSVGVVVGAVFIYYTDIMYIDPALGIIISLLILKWAYGLIKDSVRVLLEIAPKGMETDRIKRVIMEKDKRIQDLLDIHICEITNDMYDFSATISINSKSLKDAENIIDSIKSILAEEFNIYHSTIQPVSLEKQGIR